MANGNSTWGKLRFDNDVEIGFVYVISRIKKSSYCFWFVNRYLCVFCQFQNSFQLNGILYRCWIYDLCARLIELWKQQMVVFHKLMLFLPSNRIVKFDLTFVFFSQSDEFFFLRWKIISTFFLFWHFSNVSLFKKYSRLSVASLVANFSRKILQSSCQRRATKIFGHCSRFQNDTTNDERLTLKLQISKNTLVVAKITIILTRETVILFYFSEDMLIRKIISNCKSSKEKKRKRFDSNARG